jgi:hypothetical protein
VEHVVYNRVIALLVFFLLLRFAAFDCVRSPKGGRLYQSNKEHLQDEVKVGVQLLLEFTNDRPL